MGSDNTGAPEWHHQTVDQLHHVMGAYDFHRYASPEEVRQVRLAEFIRTEWAYALNGDPHARTKPLIITEAGIFSPGFSASNNPLHLSYEYGLYMADYAVQAVSAGSWAVLAWMLDDNSHKNFTWGMWHDKPAGFKLKPWFYVWALLSRFVPAGSTVYLSEVPLSDLRLLPARTPAESSKETGNNWTFVLVNHGTLERRIVLHVPNGGKLRFTRYLYSRALQKTGPDGFPVPVDTIDGDLSAGIEIVCLPEAVTLLTTLK